MFLNISYILTFLFNKSERKFFRSRILIQSISVWIRNFVLKKKKMCYLGIQKSCYDSKAMLRNRCSRRCVAVANMSMNFFFARLGLIIIISKFGKIHRIYKESKNVAFQSEAHSLLCGIKEYFSDFFFSLVQGTQPASKVNSPPVG